MSPATWSRRARASSSRSTSGTSSTDKTDRTFDQYVEWIRNEVPFLDFAPIVSISAKTGQRVGRVLEAAIDIWGERRKRDLDRRAEPGPDRRDGSNAAAAGPRASAEAVLRDPGRRRAADVRLLRLGRVGGPLQLPALPREPAARDVRLRWDADPARVPRPDSVKLPRRKKAVRSARGRRPARGPRRGTRGGGHADGRRTRSRRP